ncbi:MAG: hypothetical protein IJB75_01060 [Oscillospiraceae bacterium]|nr:hypothetical protein [Oscillospiraceae bacterium]
MTGPIITLCVLILLVVVLLLRVGVRVEYGRPALSVCILVGPGYIPVLPARKKKNETKRSSSKKAKEKPVSKRNTLELLREFLPLVLRTVKRLFGKLQVDKLDLVLTAGAKDPGDVALQYGRANAILGALWQPIVAACHVVDGRARVEVDFDAEKPEIYLLAGLTLRIGQILALAVVFAVQAIVILLRRNKKVTTN